MSDTNEYNPVTHVTVHRHVVLGSIAAVVLLIGVALLIGRSFGGNVALENGKAVVTLPDFSSLKGGIEFKNAEGSTVDAKVVPLQTPVQPATANASQAEPNGISVADDFGPDHQLQRTETDRYNIVDKLTAAITETNANVKTTNESVKTLGTQVASLDTRVTDLEKKQAAPAPAPAPQPQVSVGPVEPAPPAPSAQAAPEDQQPAQVSQNDSKGYYVPPGFHLNNGMGTPENLRKINSCQGRIVPDYHSPRCHSAGYLDPNTHKPVIRCPNKCES